MRRYLALLRGINVGGNNIIKKDELRQSFEDLGFKHVRTYIQSGNILFEDPSTNVLELRQKIEQQLSDRFSYTAHAVLFSYHQYQEALQSAPTAWGNDDTQKHNALFVLHDASPEDLLKELPTIHLDYETVTVGKHALFWSTSKEHATKAGYMELPKKKVYKQVTIRNSNTANKLLKMFKD